MQPPPSLTAARTRDTAPRCPRGGTSVPQRWRFHRPRRPPHPAMRRVACWGRATASAASDSGRSRRNSGRIRNSGSNRNSGRWGAAGEPRQQLLGCWGYPVAGDAVLLSATAVVDTAGDLVIDADTLS